MAKRRWTPKIFMSRRIAGRVLRTSRLEGSPYELSTSEVQACVDGITAKFLSTSLRQQLGVMWFVYGSAIIESGLEDPDRRSSVDDALDKIALG